MSGQFGGLLGALNTQVFEGALISRAEQPIPSSLLAGPGGLRAGVDLLQGRFGWADPETGLVTNVQAAGTVLGLILPKVRPPVANFSQAWTWAYTAACLTYIRSGIGVTLVSSGNYYVRFAAGAVPGEPVYADGLDGHAISGEAVGAFLTPWTVAVGCAPGRLGQISTSNYFGA